MHMQGFSALCVAFHKSRTRPVKSARYAGKACANWGGFDVKRERAADYSHRRQA